MRLGKFRTYVFVNMFAPHLQNYRHRGKLLSGLASSMYMGLAIRSKHTRIWQCFCFLLDTILMRGIKKASLVWISSTFS